VLQNVEIDNERYRRWVAASYSLAGSDAFILPVVQGLGRLDLHLIPADARFNQLSQEDKETIEESILLSDRFTLSYLWILGAYELVRTLDQRFREDPNYGDEEHKANVRALKHRMERLRVPLAKMEPARRHPTDDRIAYPAIHPELGIAWQIAEDTFVARRELSDALLDLAGV